MVVGQQLISVSKGNVVDSQQLTYHKVNDRHVPVSFCSVVSKLSAVYHETIARACYHQGQKLHRTIILPSARNKVRRAMKTAIALFVPEASVCWEPSAHDAASKPDLLSSL